MEDDRNQKTLSEYHSLIEAKPARVIYVDLVEHKDVTKKEFFSEHDCHLAMQMEVYGLTVQYPECTKVMFYHDGDHDEENAGIVIPNSCVVRLDWLKLDDEAIAMQESSEEVN